MDAWYGQRQSQGISNLKCRIVETFVEILGYYKVNTPILAAEAYENQNSDDVKKSKESQADFDHLMEDEDKIWRALFGS